MRIPRPSGASPPSSSRGCGLSGTSAMRTAGRHIGQAGATFRPGAVRLRSTHLRLRVQAPHPPKRLHWCLMRMAGWRVRHVWKTRVACRRRPPTGSMSRRSVFRSRTSTALSLADEAAPTGGSEASHERTSDNSESSEGPPPSEADAAAPNTSLAADASAGKTEARAASDPGACQSCESAMPAAADEQPPPTRVERAPAVSAAAPCARPGCACVSFDGHAGHFCCRTCRGTPTVPGPFSRSPAWSP
mmetsp:Transcript_27530/g.62294  ORF Transcript_27530/g.62294 Transcript_27530/m.62294 type:complete len:246 (-) Transcript_27530:184-921(-)